VPSSRIISGLIALKLSARSRVRVPISPSTSTRSVPSSGGLIVSMVILALQSGSDEALWPLLGQQRFIFTLAGWPGAYPCLVSDREPSETRAERIAQQRRELPDAPGVYLF